MKHSTVFCLLFVLGFCWIKAQPTITNQIFPLLGDTLTYAIDNQVENITISGPELGQTWDYTRLEGDFFIQQIFEQPDSGVGFPLFPQASLMSRVAEGIESYWQVTENSVELLGAYGEDPLELGILFSTALTPPLTEVVTPLNYPDTLKSSSSILIPFATSDLPDTIVALLPIAPDSFRVRTTISREDIVDGWGILQLPENNYEVLRQKRTETANIRIDAKIGFLGWQDITEVISPLLMDPEFQQDSLISYRFLSNDAREPVLIFNMDSTGMEVSNAQFKSRPLVTDVEENTAYGAQVSVFPNPAKASVQLEVVGAKSSQYQFLLFNSSGILVKEEKFWLSEAFHAQVIDISKLNPGFFVGILKNADTGARMSKPVLIIKQ